MTTLFIHPADDPETGPWANRKWSRIIDLGLAGRGAYERWSRRSGCPALPIDSMGSGLEVVLQVRDLIATGLGKVTDSAGIDWWQIAVAYLHNQIEALVWLQRVVESMTPGEEAFVSRPGFHADALRQMLGDRLQVFKVPVAPIHSRAKRYLGIVRQFPAWQVVQIFWDKHDPALEFRRRFARGPGRSGQAVILLPSAYVNVTRTALDYANMTPGLRFLLVAARRSAWTDELPSNVRAEWLASYARGGDTSIPEYPEILAKWTNLRTEIEKKPALAVLCRLGLMDNFPQRFRDGLLIRAAWEMVFQREEIQSVLCADDSNHWTLLPLLLARKYGVPAIACHHGALDGQRLHKRNAADVVLARGAMEQDYLVRVCGLAPPEVEIGAPSPAAKRKHGLPAWSGARSQITFFSEPYEVFQGRAEEFYRDVLPRLADLGRQTRREVVVKLHPAESRNERKRIINSVLTGEQREVVTLMAGSTTPELLQQTWFGITVLSTVATECALAGVPCFLCRWLEFMHQGYVDQFLRFGVGYELKNPTDIAKIPQVLERYSADPRVAANVWQPISPERLEELLTTRTGIRAAAVELQRAQ